MLDSTLEGVGLPADAIPDDEVETFVKNSSAVAIVKGARLSDSKEAGEGLRKVLSAFLRGIFGEMLSLTHRPGTVQGLWG